VVIPVAVSATLASAVEVSFTVRNFESRIVSGSKNITTIPQTSVKSPKICLISRRFTVNIEAYEIDPPPGSECALNVSDGPGK